MKLSSLVFAGTLLLAHTTANAAGEELANNSGCLACHSIDTQLIGPAYKDVAAKYRDEAGAAELLAEKVKSGGSGTWGNMPMPPNAHVKDEDIRAIVAWILSL
ncbi:c-type cytochrome [Granulosicoccaceae sp. 1_MG-2023]|nr:c-type cytochrome [Granulosicoccaceae sp. 1_MG-2023]